MTTFMQHLRSMARSYYLAFLVSAYTFHVALSNSLEIVNNTSASPPHNPLSAFSSTTRKPALGPSFTFLTDCTIWLATHEDTTNAEAGSSIHVAEIFRSRSTVRVHDSATYRLLSRINLAIENMVYVQDSEWHFTFVTRRCVFRSTLYLANYWGPSNDRQGQDNFFKSSTCVYSNNFKGGGDVV